MYEAGWTAGRWLKSFPSHPLSLIPEVMFCVLRSGVGVTVDQACERPLINDGIKKVSGLNLCDPQHS